MAATRVQTKTKIWTDAAAATALSIGSADGWVAPTAGNLIVLIYNGVATTTLPTGYTAGPSVVDDNAAYLWFKVAAGTETTLSVTQSAATAATLAALEVSGLLAAPTDVQTQSSNITSGTTTTAASITTTGANGGDWVLAVGALCRDVTTSSTVPTGLTWSNAYGLVVTQNNTGNTGLQNDTVTSLAELNQTAAGATSTALTWTTAWNGRQHLIIGFKLAAAAAAAPIPLLVMAPPGGR